MSFEKQFLSLMPHTVTLEAPTGNNAQGQPTYAGAVAKNYRARINGPTQTIRKFDREEATQLFTIWVANQNDVITERHRLTLPNDSVWLGRNPLIFSVGLVADETGHHHVKLTCGFMYHRQGQT